MRGQRAGGPPAVAGEDARPQVASQVEIHEGREKATAVTDARSERFLLMEARRLGESEAEVVDLTLKVEESLARERRLLETVTELQESLEHVRRTESELRAQLDRYATFHRDLERSLGWRVLQLFRGLIGRRW